jgi:alanine dehydrogenase
LPYQIEVARLGARGAVEQSEALRHGLNTAHGHVTNDVVARELNLAFVEPLTALN